MNMKTGLDMMNIRRYMPKKERIFAIALNIYDVYLLILLFIMIVEIWRMCRCDE